METQPQFDLTRSLKEWRTACAQSPALRPENLSELEAHLHDSMAALRRQGLSDEEVFLIATRRLGAPARLADEFGKVNPAKVWLDRLVWALVGMLFIQLISQTMFMLSSGITILWRTLVDKPLIMLADLGISRGTFSTVVGMFTSCIGLLAWVLVFRFLLSRFASFELRSTKPVRLFIGIGAIFCLISVSGYAFQHWVMVKIVSFDAGTQVRLPPDFFVRVAQSAIQSLAIPIGLFFAWRSFERKQNPNSLGVQA